MMDSRFDSVPAAPRYFTPLEQTDFLSLKHAASLKGLLHPFKGKGRLEDWASQCHELRDALIDLAERRIRAQTNGYPFCLLPVQLAQQTTGAGTAFLRWRKPDRSAMGTVLWQDLMNSPHTPLLLINDLYAMECQRLTLNMQISLLHSLGRQAHECAHKLDWAEAVYFERMKIS